jgi:hypothetical protein
MSLPIGYVGGFPLLRKPRISPFRLSFGVRGGIVPRAAHNVPVPAAMTKKNNDPPASQIASRGTGPTLCRRQTAICDPRILPIHPLPRSKARERNSAPAEVSPSLPLCHWSAAFKRRPILSFHLVRIRRYSPQPRWLRQLTEKPDTSVPARCGLENCGFAR